VHAGDRFHHGSLTFLCEGVEASLGQCQGLISARFADRIGCDQGKSQKVCPMWRMVNKGGKGRHVKFRLTFPSTNRRSLSRVALSSC